MVSKRNSLNKYWNVSEKNGIVMIITCLKFGGNFLLESKNENTMETKREGEGER